MRPNKFQIRPNKTFIQTYTNSSEQMKISQKKKLNRLKNNKDPRYSVTSPFKDSMSQHGDLNAFLNSL